MEHASAALARAEVLDASGTKHHLEETWAGRPVVLVFLRHFA